MPNVEYEGKRIDISQLVATAPAFSGVAVTPSDTVNLADTTDARALYIGVSGDVSCEMDSGTVIFKSVPVGILPVSVSRVNDTNTTATDIVALY